MGFKFLLTAVVLGLATTLVTFAGGAARLGDAATTAVVGPVVAVATRLLVAATLPTPFVTILFSSVRTAVARPFLRGAITLEMGQG